MGEELKEIFVLTLDGTEFVYENVVDFIDFEFEISFKSGPRYVTFNKSNITLYTTLPKEDVVKHTLGVVK